MEIIEFGDKDRTLYTDFLSNSKYGNILQSWEWGEVKSKFNWKAKRIGFFKNKELKGVAQVLGKKLPLGFSLFYIPRGPASDWGDQGLIRELLNDLKLFFIKEIKKDKTLFFRLEPPIEEKEEIFKLLEEKGFRRYFKTVQPPSTLLIDLTLSEEDIFKKFRRTARNLIYRSEREGVTTDVLKGTQITQNDLRGFYNLYRETGKRFSFPLRPFKQFIFLLEETGKSEIPRLYIAKIKGLILAYGIVLVLGDKAFYIWGGTARHENYSKFFNYGYIWAMLKDLKRAGVKVFDFWGLGPLENKKHPWAGFTLFKTAFGGEKIDYLGVFDLPVSKFYPLFKIADKVITPKYRATSS